VTRPDPDVSAELLGAGRVRDSPASNLGLDLHWDVAEPGSAGRDPTAAAISLPADLPPSRDFYDKGQSGRTHR